MIEHISFHSIKKFLALDFYEYYFQEKARNQLVYIGKPMKTTRNSMKRKKSNNSEEFSK